MLKDFAQAFKRIVPYRGFMHVNISLKSRQMTIKEGLGRINNALQHFDRFNLGLE